VSAGHGAGRGRRRPELPSPAEGHRRAANGDPLLGKAARTLESATALVERDPDTAYVLAYDAARYSGTALLAQQGLRPTTAVGHHAVETILRAQFGDWVPQVRRDAMSPRRA